MRAACSSPECSPATTSRSGAPPCGAGSRSEGGPVISSRIWSVTAIATSSALFPRAAPTFGCLERATLSTKWASSSASGSPFSIGIWWTGIELVSPAFTRPTFILSPKATMSLLRTRCPDWFMKSSDR